MKRWLRSLISGLEDLCIGFVCTVLGYAFLLVFFKMLWKLYCETRVCAIFRAANPGLFGTINDIMLDNVLFLSFDSVLLSLQVCLAIAIASQLLLVKRYLYDSRGLLGKVLLFGIPSTAAVTFYSGASNTDVLFIVYLMPTVNIMGYCFNFIARVAPSRA